jgi:hypothetical protein
VRRGYTPVRQQNYALGREPYRALRVNKDRGGFAMPSAAYFHRQADICLRLALIASDGEVSNRLILMAREYTAKGAALGRQSGGDAPPGAHPPASCETEDAALRSLTDGADAAVDC